MKAIFYLFACVLSLFAQAATSPSSEISSSRQQVLDCNVIFEQRKDEIINAIKLLDEKQATMQSLQQATNALIDKRQNQLKLKEASLKNQREEFAKQKKEFEDQKQYEQSQIDAKIKQNQEILDSITNAMLSKISQTYSKMPPSQAAAVLENINPKEAAKILSSLDAKVISKILGKMDPLKAATLTQTLQDPQILK